MWTARFIFRNTFEELQTTACSSITSESSPQTSPLVISSTIYFLWIVFAPVPSGLLNLPANCATSILVSTFVPRGIFPTVIDVFLIIRVISENIFPVFLHVCLEILTNPPGRGQLSCHVEFVSPTLSHPWDQLLSRIPLFNGDVQQR